MPDDGIQRVLGDRVVASFDGFAITLRTMRNGRDHVIVLGPEPLANLIEFCADMKREFDV